MGFFNSLAFKTLAPLSPASTCLAGKCQQVPPPFHALHIELSGTGNTPYNVVSSPKDRDSNRKVALKDLALPREYGQPGAVRDEKPLASLVYTGKASVMLLPKNESNEEGGLTGVLAGAKPKTKVILVDNRSDKTRPPSNFIPAPLKDGSISPSPEDHRYDLRSRT